MASIRKRTSKAGHVSYSAEVRIKGYPAQRATFKRKTDATKWAEDTQSAIRRGKHFQTAESQKHTLAELIDLYINEVLPTKKSAKSQQFQLQWWRNKLGSYRLIDVTNQRIAACKRELLKTRTPSGKLTSPATVNRYLAALSHVFTMAVKEWGWTHENPVSKVTRVKEPKGRIRFLIDDEQSRLLAACKNSDNPYLYTVVVLAISTGMRQGEIMSLEWQQVNLIKNQITLFETKNDEIRIVPLTGKAHELVSALIRHIHTPLLFPSNRHPEKPMALRSQWDKVVKEAEMHNFKFHDLRHTAASYLAMNGASLHEIAEILGHKTLAMVQRYAHLTEQHTSNVVASMNEAMING